MTHRSVAVLLCLALVSPASADDGVMIPGHEIDRRITGGVTGVAMGLGLVTQLIPLRSTDLWHTELASIDEDVRGNFSRRAASLSDAMLGLSLAAPAFYLMGSTIDDADGDRLLLYGQSIAINSLIAGVAKRLVQRPRPYLYSKDPLVQRYAKDEGDDAYMSFYSGHAALSFGAAVTGAYLLGASGTSRRIMPFAWSSGLMLAAATSSLRVRAGKHFYSDVLVGGLIGITVGYVVPALHADGDPYKPSGSEIGAGIAGILGGMLIGQLIPLEKRSSEVDTRTPGVVKNLHLAPMPVSGGFGFAIGGGM
jgi:membrane-associated phospholipid phosphatase